MILLWERTHAETQWENIDVLTGIIIEEALKIHRELGPGLLDAILKGDQS